MVKWGIFRLVVTFLFGTLFNLGSVVALELSDLTKDKCLAIEGEWIEPLNIDVREKDFRQSFCRCPRSLFFNGTVCLPISNQTLCETSDGNWVNDSCMCSENSIGFVSGLGCDYVLSIESSGELNNSISTANESKSNYSVVLIAFMLITLLSVWYLIKRRRK